MTLDLIGASELKGLIGIYVFTKAEIKLKYSLHYFPVVWGIHQSLMILQVHSPGKRPVKIRFDQGADSI